MGRTLLRVIYSACLFLAASSQGSFAAQDIIDFDTAQQAHSGVIIDTRAAELCEAASLKGARCLPAADLLGPHKRLANFSGLLWLLGSVGLTGDEHVLVAGDNSRDKEFIAGVLYLAGQRKISISQSALKPRPEGEAAPGISRSKTREKVYQAIMRDDRMILRSELADMLRASKAPVLLDGRSEGEYWGSGTRTARGGHLPGAQHLPLNSLQAGEGGEPPVHLNEGEYAIAYAHDSYESIVYLTRLVAAGMQAKVLLEGWAGWASNRALPVDAATYTDPRQSSAVTPQTSSKIGFPLLALLALAGIGLFAAGVFAGRKLIR